MQLVDRKYGRRRVVDSRGAGLERDIDDNAKGKCRTLLRLTAHVFKICALTGPYGGSRPVNHSVVVTSGSG